MPLPAWGEATGGSVVSGINSDRDTVEYNDPTIIFFPDDPAYPECVYPTIAWRGLESNGAFNSAGLFQALTGGQSHQEGDVAPGGMSAHLTKIILTTMCATADEALTKLVDEGRLPTSGTCHIAIDGQGKGWVIEQTAQECVIREQNRSVEGEGDYQIINNIFFDEEMLEHNVTDGSYDDCYPRFETVKYFLDRDYGNVTVDTLRAAMASNTYVDPETKEMSEEPYWGNDGKVYNSPEGVAAKFKTIGRMICNNTDKVAYIISGTENTEISQLPRATGTYNRIALKEDPKAMTQDAQNYAQLYIYQAARDIDNAGTVDAQRRENFELAREYFVEGINYRTLIGYISDPDEVLELYGKATSAFCRAQVYAKTTWDQPQSLASDFDNVGYIY